jgi:methylated-DNA-[protein]-cysteine S-methyltransferase
MAVKLDNDLFTFPVETPIGAMILAHNSTQIISLLFADSIKTSTSIENYTNSTNNHAIVNLVISQLNEYFEGIRTRFDLPIISQGTLFQQKVWNKLHEILYGQTTSYNKLANDLGDLKASRAVATANARNQVMIIIPCHRVISQTGNLAGYVGGIERKRWLISHEQENSKNGRLLF